VRGSDASAGSEEDQGGDERKRESAYTRATGASVGPLPGGDVTVDEMSDASFPASDPPARWTWEVRMTAADADDSDDSKRRSR
jgi:hypothetical protein